MEKLKEQGKNVIAITMADLTPDKIMNFYKIDAFVELACPRIAIDDFANYPRPLLTFKEALVAVGELSWDDILEEGILQKSFITIKFKKEEKMKIYEIR